MKRGLFFAVGALMVFVVGLAINPFINSREADGQQVDISEMLTFGREVAGVYVATDAGPVRNVQIFADGNLSVLEFSPDGQIASASQGVWQVMAPDSLEVDAILVDATGTETEGTLLFSEDMQSVTVMVGPETFTADRVTLGTEPGTDTETPTGTETETVTETETETETETATETETVTETETGTETGTETVTETGTATETETAP